MKTAMREMGCEECREALTEYGRGELPPDAAAVLERHLATCRLCADELASLRDVWQLLDSEERPDPRLEARVLASAEGLLIRRRQGVRSWFQALWPRQPVWATCYSLVLLGSGVLTGQLLPAGMLGPVAAAEGIALTEERLLQICPVRDVLQGELL